MMRRYRKGEIFRPPTVGESSAQADALEGYRRRPPLPAHREIGLREPDTVLVRNDEATDWDVYSVVELVEPLLSAGSLDPRILFTAQTPEDDLTFRSAIVTEPIGAGKIGPAVISGWMPVKLDVTHESDDYCGPEIGEDTHLLTGGGAIPIIWADDAANEDANGHRWGLVLMGDGPLPVVEFELLEAYTQFSDTPVQAAVKTWSPSAKSGKGGYTVDCTHIIRVCDFNKEGFEAGDGGYGKCYMRQRTTSPKWAGVIFNLCCPGEEQGSC